MPDVEVKRLISLLGIRTAIEIVPVIVLAAVIYWLIRRGEHKRLFGADFAEVRRKIRLNEIIRLILLCWFVLTVCITLTPTNFWYQFWRMVTFRSFSFPAVEFHQWRYIPIWWTYFVTYSGHHLSRSMILLEIIDQAENIALFVPLGFALPIIKKVDLAKTALTAFIFTFVIEFVQPFIGRSGSIDDVICNTLGGAAGYLLYLLIKAVFPNFIKKCRLSVKDFQNNNIDISE